MLTITRLFDCEHATIDKHWSGVTQVVVKTPEGGEVLTSHPSPVRAAIALAKGTVCECCTTWGRLKLGASAPTSATD